MGTDSLYYIMDYSGNYYRTNQADQLVSVVSQQDAMVFTFAQANSRICVGKKAAFYCMIPIEDSEDETDAAECEEVSPDEEEARDIFRKWDNVKRICEQIKVRCVPKKAYDAGMWGIKIITKERVASRHKRPMQFGIVITLKEMYGKNRIDDFIKTCEAKGWLVNRLDVQNQLDVYIRAEEDIEFE